MSMPVSSKSSRARLLARSSVPPVVMSSGSGVPREEVNCRGCRRGGRQLAEEIGTVGGLQRRRGKDVEDAGVGKVPIAPGEKARVIRLETRAAQHATTDRVMMNEQHASVPQRRPLALTRREMPVDRRTPRARELPRPRLDRDLNAIKLDDFGFRHAERHGPLFSMNSFCCHYRGRKERADMPFPGGEKKERHPRVPLPRFLDWTISCVRSGLHRRLDLLGRDWQRADAGANRVKMAFAMAGAITVTAGSPQPQPARRWR